MLWLVAGVWLAAQAAPPALVVGTFKDDYNTIHRITAGEWRHGTAAKYEIAEWHPDQQFFVAHNAASNPSDPGKWSRVDWVEIKSNAGQVNAAGQVKPAGQVTYEWAYCMTAYDASTQAAARAVTSATRDTPKTGCNGFPFTRMARWKE